MEIKEILYFIIALAVFTVIIAFMKMRPKQKIGYLVNLFNDGFNLRVGILKLDYEKTFTIAIENTGKNNLIVTDIYIEIKEGSKFKKHILPNNVFDNTKDLIIPIENKGAAMMDIKSFKNMFQTDAVFRAVVEIKDKGTIKSNNLLISGKKKELVLK